MKSFCLFYIPLIYLFRTRPHAVVSLLFTHLLPIVTLYCIQLGLSAQILFCSLLVLLIVESVYEIGYIQNDTETVKTDKNPTWRISEVELDFYHRCKFSIYALRVILVSFSLLFLRSISSDSSILCFGVGLSVMLLVFLFYNSFRGHINMLLYFVLSGLRYIVPFLLFPENISFRLVIFLLMIHPFIRTLEFKSSKPFYVTTNIYFRKYIIRFDVSRLHGFRVIAYVLLFLVSVVLYRISFFSFYYLLIMLYVLLFRAAIYVLYKIRK